MNAPSLAKPTTKPWLFYPGRRYVTEQMRALLRQGRILNPVHLGVDWKEHQTCLKSLMWEWTRF